MNPTSNRIAANGLPKAPTGRAGLDEITGAELDLRQKADKQGS